jgi:hypothetical protein
MCTAAGGTRSRVPRFWKGAAASRRNGSLRIPVAETEESAMTSEMQIHTIARQMLEKHGLEAIARAAQNALASERKGETEEASEWRHIEDAIKMMRGPHQSCRPAALAA